MISGAAAANPEDSALGVYLEAGQARHGDGNTESMSFGIVMPWTRRQSVQGGALSFYWDFFLSGWRAPEPNGRQRRSYTQGGVIANWRYRFSEGESPWFAEAGIGGTVMDAIYRTPSRDFSTAFQFTEQLGIGRSFGAEGAHEVSVRLQHFSNAGIKEPNPGENFWRVRYVYRF